MELIDRQQALEIKFSNGMVRRGVVYVRVDELVDKLKELPTIQPEKAQLSQEDTTSSTVYSTIDLISRQAAVDEITEYGSGDTIYMSVVELKRRIEQLPPAQPEQRWIPCSERLPEAKQRVLVTFPDGTVDIKICVDAGHLKWFFAHMTAWMPLPEPYKIGDADEK